MKVRSTTLAIAALTLWLVPSGAFTQGNSGKFRVTICHIPPGNPDAQRTLTVPESALHGHESHGDVLGPCGVYSEIRSDDYGDEFGDEPRRAKKDKKKGRKEHRGGAHSKRGTRPDADINEPSEGEQGFFRGMRRIFGFSEGENNE
jgi:hypothetical protein